MVITCNESVVQLFIDDELVGREDSGVDLSFGGILYLGGGLNVSTLLYFEGELFSSAITYNLSLSLSLSLSHSFPPLISSLPTYSSLLLYLSILTPLEN